MIALYRSGRQAEALEAYQAARRTPGRGARPRARPGAATAGERDLAAGCLARPAGSGRDCARDGAGLGKKAAQAAWPEAPGGRRRGAGRGDRAARGHDHPRAGPAHRGTQHGRRNRCRTSAPQRGRDRSRTAERGCLWSGSGVGHRQRRQHAAAGRPGRTGQRSHPSGPRPGRCGGRRRRGLGRERARRHRFRGEHGIRNSGRGDPGRNRPRRDRLGLRVGMGRRRDQRHGVQDRSQHRRRRVDHFARQCSGRDCRRRRRGLGHQPGHRRTAAHRSDGQPHLAGHPGRPEPGRPGRGRGQRLGRGRRRHCHARQSADRPGADDRGGRCASRSRLRRWRGLGRQRRQRDRVQDRSQHRRDPAHTGRKPADEPGRRRGRVVGHGAALARGPPWRHAHRHRSAGVTGSPRP